MGKKKEIKDDSKKVFLIIGIMLAIGLIASYLFATTIGSNEDAGCSAIADSEDRADCYTLLAKNTGNVEYCVNANYWFDECLDMADPNRVADSEDLLEVCGAVTDSSKRAECFEYVETNYK